MGRPFSLRGRFNAVRTGDGSGSVTVTSIGDPVQDLPALAAIPPTDRSNGQLRVVLTPGGGIYGALYVFSEDAPSGDVIPNVGTGFWLAVQSGGGGGPSTPVSQIVTFQTPFAYTSANPLDFGSLIAQDEIFVSEIVIDTAFDDPGSMLSLGLVSSPGNILPIDANDPTVLGTYTSPENILVSGFDAFRLQILPGASTQGQGRSLALARRLTPVPSTLMTFETQFVYSTPSPFDFSILNPNDEIISAEIIISTPFNDASATISPLRRSAG